MTAAYIPIWILGAGFTGLILLSMVFSRGHMITGGYVAGVGPSDVTTGQPLPGSRSL